MFKMFHGTTLTALDGIVKHGFKFNKKTAWNCSRNNMTYVYNPATILNNEDCTEDEANYIALERANEQAQIQNAIMKNPDPYTCVLEFEFEDDCLDEFEEDDSCENMGAFGANQIFSKTLNNFIKEGKCKVYLHLFEFMVKCSLIYLAPLTRKNPYFNSNKFLSKTEINFANTILDNSIFFEKIYQLQEVECKPIYFNF